MADRIERYLGRLEAELEGRVGGVRLEEILVEVEGHLRDSEGAHAELGEPAELANRLAVDGFSLKKKVAYVGELLAPSESIGNRISQIFAFFGYVILVGGYYTCELLQVMRFVSDKPYVMAVVWLLGAVLAHFARRKRWIAGACSAFVVVATYFIACNIFVTDGANSIAMMGYSPLVMLSMIVQVPVALSLPLSSVIEQWQEKNRIMKMRKDIRG